METLETCYVALIGIWTGTPLPSTTPDEPSDLTEHSTLLGRAIQEIVMRKPNHPLETLFPAVPHPPEVFLRRAVVDITTCNQLDTLHLHHMLILLAHVPARYDTPEVFEAIVSCNVMTLSLELSRRFLKKFSGEYAQNSFDIIYQVWTYICAISLSRNGSEVGTEAIEGGFFLVLAKWTLKTNDWRGSYPSISRTICLS